LVFYFPGITREVEIIFADFACLPPADGFDCQRQSGVIQKTSGHPAGTQRALYGHSAVTLWALSGQFLGRCFWKMAVTYYSISR